MKLIYAEILDLFCWGMETLTRPTLSNLLAGYEGYAHRGRTESLLERLQREELLRREGRGKHAKFTITAAGWLRVPQMDPVQSWNRPWDGAWRVLTFDLPVQQRREHKRLWEALRSYKLGLLQGSVWVWPHDLTSILGQMVKAQGVPECFCGFVARELFLCTHAEVVAAAWDWEEITRRQESYLHHPSATPKGIQQTKDLAHLAALARSEKQAYEYALAWDPLLPRALWPKDYKGVLVHTRHQNLRRLLGQQLARLANN